MFKRFMTAVLIFLHDRPEFIAHLILELLRLLGRNFHTRSGLRSIAEPERSTRCDPPGAARVDGWMVMIPA